MPAVNKKDEKKGPTAADKKKAEEAKAAEAKEAEEKEAAEKKEAEEKEAAEAKAAEKKAAKAAKPAKPPKPGSMVTVMPTKGYMFEPFEHVKLPEGAETKVKLTSWVQSQINAGLLTLV